MDFRSGCSVLFALLCSIFAIRNLHAQGGIILLHSDTVLCEEYWSSDSTNEQWMKFSSPQLYAPLGLMLGGLLTNGNGCESLKMEIAEERNEHFPNFQTHLDDYLQFAPIAAVYAMDALGYRARHDIVNRSKILLKGELLMTAVVFTSKKAFHNLRPDGSTYNSFPSGHTAQAFAAATFLAEEYGSTYRWMPYVAYGIASCVGGLRIANNRHYVSDVLMGAGVGILTMKTAYWTHHHLKRRNKK